MPAPDAPWPMQAALDDLVQGVSIFDPELRLLAWNRRFVDLLELPAPVVHGGASFAELARCLAERGELGPGDVDELVAARVRAARQCVRFYSERTTLSGRVIGAQTNPVPGGGFVTVYTDLSERSVAEALTRERADELEARVNRRTLELRTANQALRENEARVRLICDAIPAAIAYVDDRLTLRYANRLLGEMLQSRSEDAVGRHVNELVPARMWAELLPRVERALRGEPQAFEYGFRRPDGREGITRNSYIPDVGEGGAVLGLFALAIDVTEEKRAEQAMHEAQKMSAIGQLAGGLAHDFNNLLTVVIGALGALEERLGAELLREYVAPAIRASRRGVDITRRLLAFAREQPLAPAAVDVPSLIAGTAQLLRRSLPGSITIHCTSEEGGWPARVDPSQLENALVNLALNARDAMPGGGVLTLATSYERLGGGALAPGDYVKIDVADTGSGIAPELLARVLEPFFTTKPFGSGSGLGLSMVFGFARQSGGDLLLHSEVGRGTRATVLLPRAAGAAPMELATERLPVAAGGGELVLLVEDHEDVRQAIRRHLVELGHPVLEARDGADALGLLAAVPDVKLLLSDVVMPGMNGVALADEARRLVPGLRVLLISGFVDFSALGCDPPDERLVLRKPFGKDELARALARIGEQG